MSFFLGIQVSLQFGPRDGGLVKVPDPRPYPVLAALLTAQLPPHPRSFYTFVDVRQFFINFFPFVFLILESCHHFGQFHLGSPSSSLPRDYHNSPFIWIPSFLKPAAIFASEFFTCPSIFYPRLSTVPFTSFTEVARLAIIAMSSAYR